MMVLASYLLKLIICSGILFLYYHLALRNKLFHQWNRFYLLISVVLSLTIPLIQFNIQHSQEEPNRAIQVLHAIQSADGYLEEVVISGGAAKSTIDWKMVAYALVSTCFFIGMLLSIFRIFSIVRKHTTKWIQDIRFINANVPGTPFSFFHFIFWNEKIDLQTETGQQIFQHELVHVREKHTLDKLFMQLVLVLFWCNPFFWLIRRELKLIHEFIADQKAVGEQGTAALAAMILSSTYPSHFNALTNQFFQTSIKRRLAMLTKIQNPKINYLSRILVLPIMALTVLAFTLRTKNNLGTIVKLDQPFTVVIDAGHGLQNGKPNGANIGGVSEDAINLAIANKIKELNRNGNLNIVLTRTTEDYVDLHKRVDIARENSADLFISIHVNAAPPNSMGDASTKTQLKGFEVYVSNKPNSFQNQSEVFASALQQALALVHYTNPNILKRQVGIWVLDQNICPSAIVECGFLTNKADKEFISKDENQTIVAQKILSVIEQFASHSQSEKQIIKDTVPQLGVVEVSGSFKKSDNGKTVLESNVVTFKSHGGAGGDALVIINGRKASPEFLEGKQVTSKRATIYEANNPEAIKLYGVDAKKGVIVFEDAKISEYREPMIRDTVPADKSGIKEITVDGYKLKSNEVKVDKITLGEARKLKYIVIVDDQLKGTMNDVELSDENIVSVSVARGIPLVKEYGDKAAPGVILITTKNYVREENSEPIFSKVETEATINKDKWIEFLTTNLKPVIDELGKTTPAGSYTVNVRFLVKKDGSLSEFEAMNDPGYGIANKIIATMPNSPKWEPAIQNGRKVNSYHTQPITLVIEPKNGGSNTHQITVAALQKMNSLSYPNVVRFVIVTADEKGNLVRISQQGSFDNKARSLFSTLKPGAILTFESIVVKEGDKEVKKPGLLYNIVQ